MKITKIIQEALNEDLGKVGDITSNFIIGKNEKIKFQISNREPIILCGTDIALQVFDEVSKKLKISDLKLKANYKDGEFLKKNSIIIEGFGNARLVLAAERLVLNLMQHLSGISTEVKKYVDETKGTKAKILDTRKTIPNLRILQKYAVKIGGGTNHRMALYDGVLIKDNHIAAAGSVANAVSLAREGLKKSKNKILIEVECDNLKQVSEAIKSKAEIIMLDNMDLVKISEAVKLINKKAKIEVSGGVNLKTVGKIAKTGVDYISIGALTHSVKAVDIGLDINDQ